MNTLSDFCKLGGGRGWWQQSSEMLSLISLFLIMLCFLPSVLFVLVVCVFSFFKLNVIFVGFQKRVKADIWVKLLPLTRNCPAFPSLFPCSHLEGSSQGGASGEEPTYQSRRWKRQGFNPWVRKIPWRSMVTHSSIFAWRISWTEEPGGLWAIGLQRIGHDLAYMNPTIQILPPQSIGWVLLSQFIWDLWDYLTVRWNSWNRLPSASICCKPLPDASSDPWVDDLRPYQR